MACDAQTLISLAAANKNASLSKRGLEEAIAAQAAQHTSGSAPAAPVATAATSIIFDTFSANWNASAGATSYRLDVSTSNVFASFVPGYQDLNVGNVLTYSVTGLTPSTNYYYRVRAVNGAGTSGNSNTVGPVATLAFAPNLIPGLVLWLDANVGVDTVGVLVQKWNDQSATGNHFNQDPGDINQPTYNAATINGHPGISFDGNQPQYLIGTFAGPNFPFSAFSVIVPDLINSVGVTSILACDGTLADFYYGNLGDMTYYNGVADTRSDAKPLVNATPCLLEMTDDGGTIPKLYFNGTLQTTVALNAVDANALNAGILDLGISDVGAGSFPMFGAIGEVIVYNSVLSAARRVLLEQYLNTKWTLGF